MARFAGEPGWSELRSGRLTDEAIAREVAQALGSLELYPVSMSREAQVVDLIARRLITDREVALALLECSWCHGGGRDEGRACGSCDGLGAWTHHPDLAELRDELRAKALPVAR